MDIKAHQKARMILEHVKNKFDDFINREWNLVGLTHEINQHEWPPEFKKVVIINDIIFRTNSKTNFKKIKMKTEVSDKK